MRPARYLLLTSLAALILASITPLLQSLKFIYVRGRGFDEMLAYLQVARDAPGMAALWATLASEGTNLMYFGVLGIMLYSIWRDEGADWTVAASQSVKLALLLMGLGLAGHYLNYLFSYSSPGIDPRAYLRFDFFATVSLHLIAFGMTLWLHALASNQIPKLMDLAVARRPASVGMGLILFWTGFALNIGPYAGSYMSTGVNRTPEDFGYWLAGSVGFPLMLVSYSLLSMGYLAAKEIEAREDPSRASPRPARE